MSVHNSIQSIFVTFAFETSVSVGHIDLSGVGLQNVQSLKIPVEFMHRGLAQLRHHVVDDITTPQMGNSWTFILEQSVIIIITKGSKYHGLSFDF